LKVIPLVAQLISIPDDLSLEEFHNILQLVLGWSGQASYNFRILAQEIGRCSAGVLVCGPQAMYGRASSR
jgi:hypothetical protein